jgi:hypothetical protein
MPNSEQTLAVTFVAPRTWRPAVAAKLDKGRLASVLGCE